MFNSTLFLCAIEEFINITSCSLLLTTIFSSFHFFDQFYSSRKYSNGKTIIFYRVNLVLFISDIDLLVVIAVVAIDSLLSIDRGNIKLEQLK